LRHASSIDSGSKKLVLGVLKIITEFHDDHDVVSPNYSSEKDIASDVNNVHQKESQCFGLSGFAIPSNVDIPNSSLGFNTNQSASHVPLSCHRPASERIPLLVVTLVTKIQLYKVIIWLARIRYHHHPISILL